MIQKMYTVYDEKAEAYLDPFFVSNEGLATRAFTDCINSPSHQFGKHPHDYTLFCLGEWDNETAKFNESRKLIGNGVEFRQALKPTGAFPHEINAVQPLQSNSPS